MLRALVAEVRPVLPQSKPLKSQPHVVLAVMESMGRDVFESHKPGVNDTLGALAGELDSALVFKQSLCVGQATFPTLEGLLFDSPLNPITQSRYGRHVFDFSRMLEYKKAGYRTTIFLTAGPEAWRQIETNFPQQGFDEIVGAGKLSSRYPGVENGTWGVGDAWMFTACGGDSEGGGPEGEKLFIVMLSTANHPPHRVPDGVKVNPVSYKELPPFITDNRYDILTGSLETYQYAANALGGFVHDMRRGALKRELLIVATGDHNLRMSYAGGYAHHLHGVPILIWAPESLEADAGKVDVTRWAGHRDIFPTIAGVVLGRTPEIHEGRNLFANESMDSSFLYGHRRRAAGCRRDQGHGSVTCLSLGE
ncbi:MAG: LTA synthase family protein [Sutterella wadsworthensis]